ncbi:MAG: acetyl-CoA carboxylase biotin carboxylase subunit [Alicyclobacillus sp.]|nr:acetyl-CoA carboxylase biotin carboxylase subunit [Alicyclobacillus sp.]
MFRKVLIANRGEIARRVIRTCRAMGIATVAVYSDADANALHVREADEAVRIGPPPVAASYLQVDAVMEAARQTQADALHPGYGLLSENPALAEACADAGVTFIGPPAHAIREMGSKIRARQLMREAGVPIVPGSDGEVADLTAALQTARDIGYPVMLKASGGGGGIGMQVVESDAQLEKAFAANQQRAKSYFGSGAMFLEKYLEAPRHIEIQLLFDTHGHGVYLWERECSIQRRHQKVIEEAPSALGDAGLRKRMGEAALAAGRAIGYTNAGTVEFIVDGAGHFYFLEMNTRLQVEHPVTEAVTGLDLVELQLRVAAGEPLPFDQAGVALNGHAIECRIYAEDPVRMLPSPGTIQVLELPTGEGVRNDVGVESGSVVTPYYDPMIGKLIVHAPTREAAIAKMAQALAEYRVEGIKTNLPLLAQIVAHPQFQAGATTTDFIRQYVQNRKES